MIRRLVTKMGTLTSKLWPPSLHLRTSAQKPIVPPIKAPPPQRENSPANDENAQNSSDAPSQPTQEQQDYLDVLENLRRQPAEIRRTDRFFVLLFALITLAWIAAAVIWWLRRR